MYGYSKKLQTDFASALQRTKEKLSEQGFGIISEIDVKATFAKKLGIEYGNYAILGACNPKSAKKALDAEKEIGLMLPCNVIVYESGGNCFASAILPTQAMAPVQNPSLNDLAKEIEGKLKAAIDSI